MNARSNLSTLALLAALGLILGTIVALKFAGVAINDVAALGLGVAIGNITSGLTPGPQHSISETGQAPPAPAPLTPNSPAPTAGQTGVPK